VAANDVVAGRGNNTFSGSAGSDHVIGGVSAVITGSIDSDLLAGDPCNDTLRGSDDDDVLLLGPDLVSANGDARNGILVVTDDALTGFDTRLKIPLPILYAQISWSQ
jgi:Ca2+-binding RTX toxin-like protein